MICLYSKIIVIGGGALGLIAAITAKDMGAETIILEGNDRVGKKLLCTGNGRCNLTNKDCIPKRFHSENSGFFIKTLNSFTSENTVDFFASLGLPVVTLEEGRVYPMSLQASSVVDILRYAAKDRCIPIYTGEKVKSIYRLGDTFKITTGTQNAYECNRIILCCGGKSCPNTGSDGSGYELAKMLGHSITGTIPAIVQLKLDFNHLKALSGVKFDGAAEIWVNSNKVQKESGEILFTDYGISGPPVLQLSRCASYYISKGQNVSLKIDIMPSFSENHIKDFFENHWGMLNYRSIADSFIGIINKKIIPVLLKESGITDIHKPCSDISYNEKISLFKMLKNWNFKVSGTNSFKDSQVTAGGINTKEVNAETLESEILPGVYFCGEILDVDGDCGGFNLQWAWSSGYTAGKSAAKSVLN